MKQAIRRWLGIEELHTKVDEYSKFIGLTNVNIGSIRNQLEVTNEALGRIIAKLDPMFAIPEDDPARRAESDRIGREAIRKMAAEVQVRRDKGVSK